MHARVTLLEIDTVRTTVAHALDVFEHETLERLRNQRGYRGVWAMANAEGKGVLMSLWDTAEQAATEGDHNFYAEELGRFTTFFRSPPGRDRYEVLFHEETVSTEAR
jgi:hypothetical protein